MIGYFLGLGLWIACLGAVALYWYRRIERQRRAWLTEFERRKAENDDRFAEQRAQWDAEDARTDAEYRAAVAEAWTGIERINQLLIARGMEPTPPPEPLESSP